MSKYRRAARVDTNQGELVKALRRIPSVTVELGHDDILVGYQGKTYWYEIKTGPKAEVKESQKKLLAEWKGHYKIVWTIDMILKDMGIS